MLLEGDWLRWLSVNRPDGVIGQLGDEGGLGGGEEEEAASPSSDTSRPTDTVNVLRCCCRRSVLQKPMYLLSGSRNELLWFMALGR